MGEESADQIMNGKHFSNAMKIHHAVVEALTRKKKRFLHRMVEEKKSQQHSRNVHIIERTKKIAGRTDK